MLVYCQFYSVQAIYRLAKFNGRGNFINHRQSAETRQPRRILAQLRIEPMLPSIGVQPVDIGSTTTVSIRPRTTLEKPRKEPGEDRHLKINKSKREEAVALCLVSSLQPVRIEWLHQEQFQQV